MTIKTSNLGYPRIGENREWKKALESFWSGQLSEEELLETTKSLRLSSLKKQKENGIDLIPVNDFTLYDHVLDTAVMFGLVPKRFTYSGGPVSLSTYFSIARGNKDVPASEMTKWFDTNYHYIVPELADQTPVLVENKPLNAYLEAKNELGIEGKPVILGPFTFLKLAKGYEPEEFSAQLDKLVPVYIQLLQELEEANVQWVQIDESSLVTTLTEEEQALFTAAYKQIAAQLDSLSLLVQTYFDAVTNYEAVVQLPVQGIGLDFVHGRTENLKNLHKNGFPEDKVLGLGLVDGRNIWKSDLNKIKATIEEISAVVPTDRQLIQPSCSLLHVPVTVAPEQNLEPIVKDALAFADEKLHELSTIKKLVTQTDDFEELLAANQAALTAIAESEWRNKAQKDGAPLKSVRTLPFEERQKLQHEKFNLPLLPTTTIGSFPQTKETRRTRNLWRKGDISTADYEQFVKKQIEKWIQIQEDLDLDVLVHGEFERTDMVEFFGEKLDGFTFTKNGWVQSYGSRCVKPPIIFGDVQFIEPMTVKETVYAQNLTKKPVKGMLTGPVTILNWSFVRNDLSLKDVTFQIAEALIHELEALEAAGIEMIQVDEPAIREGLPLKKENWQEYLDWAVEAFRIATATVKDTTQVHTHMCYSEFHEIIEAISNLDADVISIETSRSHGELISTFESNVYNKGIGLGVYDIHSPRVPSKDEMLKVIDRALDVLPAELFWVNPDCGLKTRQEPETIAALEHMVQAAHDARKKL